MEKGFTIYNYSDEWSTIPNHWADKFEIISSLITFYKGNKPVGMFKLKNVRQIMPGVRLQEDGQ